jgi:NTE family protein
MNWPLARHPAAAEDDGMTTAFVFAGGGSLGAVEVGMLAALTDADIRPDLVVGTSVGAANAVWFASNPSDVDGLAARWNSLSRHDVFPIRPVRGLLGLLGLRDHLVPNTALRRVLADSLGDRDLARTRIPAHVGSTDVLSGAEVVLSSGNAVDAVLASTAIPAVFPPIRLGDRYLMDGGAVNNNPVSHAVDLGAERIWVLPTGYACALTEPPRGALAVALHALTLLVNNRLTLDVERYRDAVDLRVVPSLCPLRVSPGDFSRSRELISAARASTEAWLGRVPSGSRSRLRHDQARLVGDHHELRAVAGVQLGHGAVDVGLRGERADHHGLRDLVVGQSAGDQRHGLALAAGEVLQAGLRTQRLADVPVDQPAGDRRREQRVAARRHPDGVQEVLRLHVLHQEPGRAGLQRVEHVLVQAVVGEDHDVGAGESGIRRDPPGRLDAVHPRHLDVDQRDVGQVVPGLPDAFLAVRGLRHDLDVVLGVEQRPETAADQRLVVDEQNPDHGCATGSSACTRKPPSLRGAASSLPPSAVTRSRMPSSPTPGCGAASGVARPSSSTRMCSASGR